MITNPTCGLYKFFSRGVLSEALENGAMETIRRWADNNHWSMVKEKRKYNPSHQILEVKAWLR